MLHALDQPVNVLTTTIREQWADGLAGQGMDIVMGDARYASTLRSAGVDVARSVIIAVDEDTVAAEIASAVKNINPDVPLIVRATDQLWATFFERGFSKTRGLCVSDLSAISFAASALSEPILLTDHIHGHVFSLQNMTGVHSAGRTVAETQSDIRGGIFTVNEEIPVQDQVIAAGDRVLVGFALDHEPLASQRGSTFGRRLLRYLHSISPFQLLGLARDVWRNASSTMRAGAITISVLILGTSVAFFVRNENHSPFDAIFYAVATAAGVTVDPWVQHQNSGWKVFDMAVILLGALLLGVVFTMIAEYIISRRFLSIAGRMSTTVRNHVVVAGLGRVGSRVAKILLARGEEVVGIEMDPDCRDVGELGSLMPVLIGDASSHEVLARANMRQARSIIAATASDANNIRIALNAEQFNPRVLSVVRIFDVLLAKTLDQSYGIHMGISPADTSAPTFCLAAMCPHARIGIRTGDHLFGVFQVTVEPGDRFDGLRAVELGHQLLYPMLVSDDGATFDQPLPQRTIRAGETLVFSAEWAVVRELPGFTT